MSIGEAAAQGTFADGTAREIMPWGSRVESVERIMAARKPYRPRPHAWLVTAEGGWRVYVYYDWGRFKVMVCDDRPGLYSPDCQLAPEGFPCPPFRELAELTTGATGLDFSGVDVDAEDLQPVNAAQV